MKTIKQIADALGVSRQAIYKKMNQEPLLTGLQSFIVSKRNVVYITDEGIELISSSFSTTETDNGLSTVSTEPAENLSTVSTVSTESAENLSTVSTVTTETVNRLSTVSTEPVENLSTVSTKFIDSLQAQVDALIEQNRDLRSQLNIERQHNREQTAQLAELARESQRLLSNSQVLLGIEQSRTNPVLLNGEQAPRPDAREGLVDRPGVVKFILRIFSKDTK
jgi:predicted transcriptional regulator